MDIKQELSEIISNALVQCGFKVSGNLVSFSNKPELADFQSNICFALAKQYKMNPADVAEQIISKIDASGFDFSFCAPAFINIKLTDEKLSKIANDLLADDNLGVVKTQNPKVIFLDYGGANVAKELHVGHLRSPIIGEGIKNLYKLFGHKTIADVHFGDWGLQMGLTIAQLEDDGLLDFYFKGKGQKPEITLDMLNIAYPKASKRKETDENFKKKAELYTLWLQQKKEPYFTIWKQLREPSVKTIMKNYDMLNIHFDLTNGESSASDKVKQTIDLFVSSGLARKSQDALVVDVAKEGENIPIPKKHPDDPQFYKNPMPPAIIQKSNGGELYMTTDLATMWERNIDYNPDEIVYITDNRQIEHFIKLFRCAKMSGISPESQKLTHVAFGTICGSDGKPFKTRSGETVKLEDVVSLVTSKAEQKLKQNGLGENKDLALKIGVAALKFGDLSNDVSKDYVLDLDKFSSFEGKTGPYLQYTNARINSLLEKAGYDNSGEILVNLPEERTIIIALLKLIESFKTSLENLSLAPLCNAVFALASSYSTFYNNVRILTEQNLVKKQGYLALSKLVQKAIAKGLDVLAIDTVKRM